MSYANGWDALNLHFSSKIPRTEYSVHAYHWALMKAVTGIDTDQLELRPAAQRKFLQAWDYSIMWRTDVSSSQLAANGGRITAMGHAVYGENTSGKGDFNPEVVCPFADVEDVYALDPCREYREFDRAELVRFFEGRYADAQQILPDTVNMGGVYVSMFSGLIAIFGWELLLEAIAYDEKKFGKVIEGYYQWVKQFFDAYAACSIPVMMMHDDLCWTSGPAASPFWYRRYIFPYLKKLIEPLEAAGKKVIFTSDGTIDEFFPDIVDLGVDSVVMEPSSNMALFAERYGDHVGFVGGMDCRTLTFGTPEEIEYEMSRVMAYGRRYPGFILAVGNHLPADVPVERALLYNELYERFAAR
ncbi:MAG: Uroporphyrinogen decarboxylase [Lentisphaerae bacterium ADurb.Bin242]|nr:MAG: Uroporphyrinogen decarboxylase [Lentisphaerae bacterium ADurb.Bin242]